jgi:hypothetical protein
MPTLGSDKFDLGWIPSEDAVRGRANGLVRMDNLCLDEDGSVQQTRGTVLIGTLPSAAHSLYTKTLNGVKHRYAGLLSGTVLKSVGGGEYSETVLTGGNSSVGYGATLGQVLVCSGDQKKKDDGNYIRNLGLETPEAPEVELQDKYSLEVDMSGASAIEGTGAGANIQADRDTFRVVQEYGAVDLSAIKSGVSETHSDSDKFTLWLKVGNSTLVQRVRLEILLEVPGSESDQVKNFYFYEWDFQRNLELLNKGLNADVGLELERHQFHKVGFDSSLGWPQVQRVRVIIENAAVQNSGATSLVIEGGQGSLTGLYQYIQVNCWFSGKYVARSIASPDSETLEADHQCIKITPFESPGFNASGHENEYNKIFIYRRNLSIGGDYLLVAIREDLSQFEDNVSDIEATDGIPDSSIENRTANLFLEEVPDNIIAIIPNYFRRTVYVTPDFIKVSDMDNPDATDSRIALDTSGETSERNLWAIKVAESSLLVGTTVDIYNITGTLQILPDGSPDVRIRALGVNPPPISKACAVFNSAVIYMSGAGWQILSGSVNESLIGATRLLYEGHDRYGISQVVIGQNDEISYDCVVVKNKLVTSVTITGHRRIFVYDFIKRYWYPWFLAPNVLAKEEDDTLLGGFSDDSKVRILGETNMLDNTVYQEVYLQTCYLDGGQPNNRKDLKVLKIYADSGNWPMTIEVSKDGQLGNWTSLGTHSFNGPTIVNISLSTTNLHLGKSYALRITGTPPTFKFYYWTVEYEARPEQVNFIRVPPTNFGVAGRKRFYDLPFSIDALGNNFSVRPYLDGMGLSVQNFGGSPTKDFYTIAFRNETVGHELGLEIQVEGNNVIEFYEMLTPRHTEQLPDLARWFRIPYTNLGTPARKRFVRVALVIDTRGASVTFTPLVDQTSLPALTFTTNKKETVIYYVTSEVVGTDLGGVIDGGETPFEFYGWDQDETVTEALPAPAKFIHACTDFGTAARKRFSRNSFVCNPGGGPISFTPILDGVYQPAKTFSGNRKETFSYYYTEDKIFVDFCYEVKSLGGQPFEFYEVLKPEILETLPEPVKFYRIPRSNLGTDARKRFFAFAFMLNTR